MGVRCNRCVTCNWLEHSSQQMHGHEFQTRGAIVIGRYWLISTCGMDAEDTYVTLIEGWAENQWQKYLRAKCWWSEWKHDPWWHSCCHLTRLPFISDISLLSWYKQDIMIAKFAMHYCLIAMVHHIKLQSLLNKGDSDGGIYNRDVTKLLFQEIFSAGILLLNVK